MRILIAGPPRTFYRLLRDCFELLILNARAIGKDDVRGITLIRMLIIYSSFDRMICKSKYVPDDINFYLNAHASRKKRLEFKNYNSIIMYERERSKKKKKSLFT